MSGGLMADNIKHILYPIKSPSDYFIILKNMQKSNKKTTENKRSACAGRWPHICRTIDLQWALDNIRTAIQASLCAAFSPLLAP